VTRNDDDDDDNNNNNNKPKSHHLWLKEQIMKLYVRGSPKFIACTPLKLFHELHELPSD
jgi:hypothetical protein